jgi:hypothetical protein
MSRLVHKRFIPFHPQAALIASSSGTNLLLGVQKNNRNTFQNLIATAVQGLLKLDNADTT